jgi:Protein of unknown function VcgC/VcgE (DUF2780)
MKARTHQSLCRCAALLICSLFLAPGAPTYAQTSGATSAGASALVGQLSKQLSITRTQARGGAGSLFSLAKSRLTSDEFSKISAAVPGMSGLLKAAPQTGGNSELSALEGNLPGNMGRMAEVAGAFNKLGLSPSMAGKFLPIMTKFVESKGGQSTAALLEKGLK